MISEPAMPSPNSTRRKPETHKQHSPKMKTKPAHEQNHHAAADIADLGSSPRTILMDAVATLARHTALNLNTQVDELEETFSAMSEVLTKDHPAQKHLEDALKALRDLGSAGDNLRLTFLSPANCVGKCGLVI